MNQREKVRLAANARLAPAMVKSGHKGSRSRYTDLEPVVKILYKKGYKGMRMSAWFKDAGIYVSEKLCSYLIFKMKKARK